MSGLSKETHSAKFIDIDISVAKKTPYKYKQIVIIF